MRSLSVSLVFMVCLVGLDHFKFRGGYCFNRKNRFPLGGALVVALLTTGPRSLPELPVTILLFVWSVQPVTDGGHETMAWLPELVMVSSGAAASMARKRGPFNPLVAKTVTDRK